MESDHSLLTDTVVYLGAAVVFVPIASRLKLGSVLGYLAAGCVIGPSCLGLITDVDTILRFAEFGVVLMLFLIGLELDTGRLWEMRKSVFGGGALQMGVCGAVLAAGGLLAGLSWKGALIGGLAVALSSTAIAVQTMKERGELGSPAGQVGFGILLFQDVAAIPLVAIVPLLAEGGPAQSGVPWLGIAKVVAAIVGVVVIGRFATQPLLRTIAKTNLREVFTAFTLLLVVGIAHVMQLAGISMALGAFLAGVLLASSEYRHALETDIEPFKGLLMGLFFIAVGMSIDFGLVASRPLLLAALVLGFVVVEDAGAAPLGAPARRAARIAARLLRAALAGRRVRLRRLRRRARSERLARRVGQAPHAGRRALDGAHAAPGHRRGLRAAPPLPRPQAGGRRHRAPRMRPSSSRASAASGRSSGACSSRAGSRPPSSTLDPDQIELLRSFGFRVFYGDATRLDLLHAAGADQARVIVNAIDDVDSNLRLVDVVRENFPRATIVARARNVGHLQDLRRRGVTLIEREVFDSALGAGRRVLEVLGVHPFEARERAFRFRRHNVGLLESLAEPIDETERLARVRAARDELERQFQMDIEEIQRLEGGDWQDDPRGQR